MIIKGLIRKQISNQYTVIDLETKLEYNAVASGKLRYVKVDENSSFNKTYGRNTKKQQQIIKVSPKVGDKILLDTSMDQNVIIEIKDRINDLIRPDVANVDQVLLVFSCIRPVFSFHLLDKFLVILNEQNLNVTLVISKIDLISEEELTILKEKLEYYRVNLNMEIYYVNSKQRIGFDVLEHIFKDKITVLAGQTGVGKSTLLNALIPELKLKTQEISDALGRGKHTTRHSELYDFNEGYICDTPGFSKIEINIYEKEELKSYYEDFTELSHDCKFNTCNHINEPNCAIKEAVKDGIIPEDRYENYVKFYEEIESKKNKY
ncbi:ribosome small subunit-dependent GTPase A [Haploplasma axanthum]|nr:ribosome small subunit-dependent GTPase A [Haploplasma axanthum]